MMKSMKQYLKACYTFLERVGMNRAARELQLLGDDQLNYIGVSREQLQYGNAASLWSTTAEPSKVVQTGNFKKPSVDTAAVELNQQAA